MRRILITLAFVAAATAPVWTAIDYLTEGGDNGRTGWLKDERAFTPANVARLALLWKVRLDTPPREMHHLYPPLVIEHVNAGGRDRELLVEAGVSDDLFGLDAATGAVVWKTHFDAATPLSGNNTFCPGGQTAVPTIGPGPRPGTYTIYAVSGDGRLRQLDAADGQSVAPPELFLPPNGKVFALNLQNNVIYTTVAQGCGGVPNAFFSFDLASRRTSAFLPGGGGQWGRRGPAVAPDGTMYMGTGDGPYSPAARNLGDSVVAVKLDANKQLQLADYYAPPDANWMFKRDLDINVSPVAFDYRGRKFLVTSGKACRVWLLDRDALGGDDHRTALDVSPLICNENAQIDIGVWGTITAWQDARGVQWLDVPFWGPVAKTFHAPVEYGRPEHGGVVAFKVEQTGGKWRLTPAWISRDMNMADETTVAGGVVFTFGTGEDIRQLAYDIAWDEPRLPPTPAYTNASAGSARRIMNSTHATIYALDGQTGKELWSSGDQVTSFSHFAGISVANGHVYLPTYGGDLYCFGLRP